MKKKIQIRFQAFQPKVATNMSEFKVDPRGNSKTYENCKVAKFRKLCAHSQIWTQVVVDRQENWMDSVRGAI